MDFSLDPKPEYPGLKFVGWDWGDPEWNQEDPEDVKLAKCRVQAGNLVLRETIDAVHCTVECDEDGDLTSVEVHMGPYIVRFSDFDAEDLEMRWPAKVEKKLEPDAFDGWN